MEIKVVRHVMSVLKEFFKKVVKQFNMPWLQLVRAISFHYLLRPAVPQGKHPICMTSKWSIASELLGFL